MENINILHLSDLHFGITPYENRTENALDKRNESLNPLLNELEQLDMDWKPQVIVITGDIAYRGTVEQYNIAMKWIQELMETLKIGPDNLIICAGNHDRHREESNESELPQTIEEADNRLKMGLEKISIPFKVFEKFQNDLCIPPLLFNESQNYLVGTRKIYGLNFLVLNSAWFSWGGETDIKKAILGKTQIEEMKKSAQIISRDEQIPQEITIGLMHHPPEDLFTSEITTYNERIPPFPLLAECTDFLLCGHEHGEDLFTPDKKYGRSWLFRSGALYEGPNYKNNCEILRVNKKTLCAERLKICYQPNLKEWKSEEDKFGIYTFSTHLSRLRWHSYNNIHSIRNKIGLDCTINRIEYINQIKQSIEVNHVSFIVGKSMVGKSALMRECAMQLFRNKEVLFFTVNNFNHLSLTSYLNEINIDEDFEVVLNSFSEEIVYIFVDQCERLLEDPDYKLKPIKDILQKSFAPTTKPEVHLILTCRTGAFKDVQSEISQWFPLDLRENASIININVLNDDELNQVITSYPLIELLNNKLNLKVLLKNPKMLDILVRNDLSIIEDDGESITDLYLTETKLMDRFWNIIIRNNGIPLRNGIIPEKRIEMLNEISINSFKNAKPIKIRSSMDVAVLNSLISDDILIRMKDQVSFSHDVYEEWSLLDYIRKKSDLKNDFLIPTSDFKRKSRAFELFSRYILEVEGDINRWKILFTSLEDDEQISPSWKQEYLLGILTSEASEDLINQLKSFFLEGDGHIYYDILKILELKCVNWKKENKKFIRQIPGDYFHSWFFTIDFILRNFSLLNDRNLNLSIYILHLWLIYNRKVVAEYILLIHLNYMILTEKVFFDEEVEFSLDYNEEKDLKKRLIYGILYCKVLLGDLDLSIIERIKTSQEGRLILRDVLFQMSGWILIYRISPRFCVDILRTFLIREEKEPQILPRPFDLHEFNFSFERQDFSSEDIVKMLNLEEEWGLQFIHLINNEAIQLWKKLEGPLHYGPLLTQISDYYDRTPICQTLNLEDKEVEVWGDEMVYKWIFHLGPDIVKATLEGLEKWMFSKIENDRQDPKQLVKKILSETTSFAVVATCLKVILSLIFKENGEFTIDKDRIGLLLESILPILRKPAFWYLHSQLFAEARVYRRSNIPTVINVIDLLVFVIPTASISEEIISNIGHFKESIPFFYEQEKSVDFIRREREEWFEQLNPRLDSENYKPIRIGNFIGAHYEPPEKIERPEEVYGRRFLEISSYKGNIFSALQENGLKNISLDEFHPNLESYLDIYDFFMDTHRYKSFIKRYKKHLEKSEKSDQDSKDDVLPDEIRQDYEYFTYRNHFKSILELVTGYSALLIKFHKAFIEKNGLKERCRQILLNTSKFKLKTDEYNASMIYSQGIYRSVARALPQLLIAHPRDKKIRKAIKYFSTHPNHQVCVLFYTALNDILKKFPKIIWKSINRVEKKSKKRAILFKPKFMVINKLRDARISKEQFIGLNKRLELKLYIKRALIFAGERINPKKLENRTPEEIDLKFYRSILNLNFEKLEHSKVSKLIKNLFYFTVRNDIKYRKDDRRYEQSYYGDCKSDFYNNWINSIIPIFVKITYDDNFQQLSKEMIDHIKIQWLNVDVLFYKYLDELFLDVKGVSEENLIQIWTLICQFVLDAITRGEKVRSKVLSALFFRKEFYSNIQREFNDPETFKHFETVLSQFLEIKAFPEIIWLLRELIDFNSKLAYPMLDLILLDIKKRETLVKDDISFINILSSFLSKLWEIENDSIKQSDKFGTFKNLIDFASSNNNPLASAIQEEIKG